MLLYKYIPLYGLLLLLLPMLGDGARITTASLLAPTYRMSYVLYD
jgi:hypothetical protein